jgi:hypothetical protein
VALNAVPARRGLTEVPDVITARKAIRKMNAPLWRGAISQRTALAQALAAGQSAAEFNPTGIAAQEFGALWGDVSRVVETVDAEASAHS